MKSAISREPMSSKYCAQESIHKLITADVKMTTFSVRSTPSGASMRICGTRKGPHILNPKPSQSVHQQHFRQDNSSYYDHILTETTRVRFITTVPDASLCNDWQ